MRNCEDCFKKKNIRKRENCVNLLYIYKMKDF